ncbi:helix-turn-helix domain-containing protein [Sphingobacterium composti Ten et al. 2007 non Yoo et al. 2007]|uniref:helix-turn-helix domain-containing protein n=1 Tax=Sphingobacterium composti TaxID=363260 RepID=UPI00135CD5F7|nr:helix-turn-helix domain-containing protein [Sphingobacterium composti Ten et al. 2007 non Yoo et al. 2007]
MASAGKKLLKQYFDLLDQHIDNVVNHVEEEFLEINQIAEKLNISHGHLTETLQKETGHHPCHYYDLKIIDAAKRLLSDKSKSVADVARTLTYDPSNFSKFIKKFTGLTPGELRKQL